MNNQDKSKRAIEIMGWKVKIVLTIPMFDSGPLKGLAVWNFKPDEDANHDCLCLSYANEKLSVEEKRYFNWDLRDTWMIRGHTVSETHCINQYQTGDYRDALLEAKDDHNRMA